jgi:hypothetical protein
MGNPPFTHLKKSRLTQENSKHVVVSLHSIA